MREITLQQYAMVENISLDEAIKLFNENKINYIKCNAEPEGILRLERNTWL